MFGLGLGVGLRLGLGTGLSLRPYLDPTRKYFLAPKLEQPTTPMISETRSLGNLTHTTRAIGELVMGGCCGWFGYHGVRSMVSS